MRRIRVLLIRLAGFFHKGHLERDLEEELQFHLQVEIAENERKGMTPEDAKSAATRRLGSVAQIKETYRATRSLPALESLLQDVSYGVRMLRKRPSFAIAGVLSLALGIGANTAVFSVVDALLLKPLPYPNPDRLVILWPRSPDTDNSHEWASPSQYRELRTQNHSFEEISVSQGITGILRWQGQPEHINALLTSSGLFHMLGAKPFHGRLLLPEDDQGTPAVAVLSYEAWQRLFNGDPKIVGSTISLNGVANNGTGAGAGSQRNLYTVVGVLSPEFLLNQQVFPTNGNIGRIDVFVSMAFVPAWRDSLGSRNYNLVARLKPGVTLRQAQADVSVIADGIRNQDYRDPTFTISVVPLIDQMVGSVRPELLVLLGAVALVLLIACASVANLLLSRDAGRQREVAVRMAIGAGWQRLVRQWLTESLLLGLIGGAAGLVLAKWSLYMVRRAHPGNLPLPELIEIDRGVLAFTFGISILTAIIFGLAPAWRAARVDLNTALKSGGTPSGFGGFRASRRRLRGLLVISELALSVMLLIGAGLMIRSFVRLESVPPGFNPDHLITMRLSNGGPPTAGMERQVFQAITNAPGVKGAAWTNILPLTPGDYGWWSLSVEGFTPGEEHEVEQRSATPEYFRVMQIPLLKGRIFSDRDSRDSVLIDEKFAQHFWPGADPVGKHVWIDDIRHPAASWQQAQGHFTVFTIVGVVGTVKHYGLNAEGRMVLYTRGGWFTAYGQYVVASTSADPSKSADSIIRSIYAVAPNFVVDDVRTMHERLSESVARQRFSSALMGAFAVFALLLAAIGAYGVMSDLVAQNTHELGVRIALGAQRSRIIGMVVREGMELAGAGIVAGIVGAAALNRVMTSLLFGISAMDAVTFSAVPVILAAVALLATYLPARRATQMDPMAALRED
jgi:predicted permease